jgi:hypothetical protein
MPVIMPASVGLDRGGVLEPNVMINKSAKVLAIATTDQQPEPGFRFLAGDFEVTEKPGTRLA